MSRADTLLRSQTFRTTSVVPMMTVPHHQSTCARASELTATGRAKRHEARIRAVALTLRLGSFHRHYFLDEVSHRVLTSGVYCSIP